MYSVFKGKTKMKAENLTELIVHAGTNISSLAEKKVVPPSQSIVFFSVIKYISYFNLEHF